MKYNFNNILIIISSFFLLASTQDTITFTKDEQFKELENSKQFVFTAKYDLNSQYKYLYMYPKNKESGLNLNKAIIKIYFKQNSPQDSNQNSNINYLNSDYSTIDFNSGLFIQIKDLKYGSATIFIISYEECHLLFQYKYTNNLQFPSPFKYSNFQFNQFILGKEAQNITYIAEGLYNDYLLILSKTSLRNIEVIITYKKKDVTEEKLAYLYPNGCSVFLNRDVLTENFIYVYINNKDKNNNEIILLGYMHHINNEIFPNPITNGYQVYLEGNYNRLEYLLNSGNKNIEQYYTYQAYSKNILIYFYDPSASKSKTHYIEEYNSVLHYNLNYDSQIRFEFGYPIRNAFYFQYLDFTNNNITQKSLQPLVTGVPKSMIVPAGKSMYHFLPIERYSSHLNYYLRAKNEETIYVSFETCLSYPEGCNFEGIQKESVKAISNIGLWNTLETKRNELQLIYVFCKKECAYDILMTYDEDPFFLFPENNYTKFIGDKGVDTYALPVFEFFETIEIQSLYIDLIVFSGKADLILKDGRDGNLLDYSVKRVGNKQTYNISSDKFLNNKNYYKKDIYAVVKQSANYKNTFYNIMYGTGEKNSKTLSNNVINMELLTVGNEADEKNTFIFDNKGTNLYVSIHHLIVNLK